MEMEIAKLDTKLVENDIATRRIEAHSGWEFAQKVDQIETALRSSGRKLDLTQWCKQALGVDVSTMRRRKRLYRHWSEYEAKRREIGQCGQSGRPLALSLVKNGFSDTQRTGKVPPVLSGSGTSIGFASGKPMISGCQLITGDALTELPKFAVQSVNVVVTSPPYWPPKRTLGGIGTGFEPTLDEYLVSLRTMFHETCRVLPDDGTLWVSIDDSLEDGNLLHIPTRLAMALQTDGWVCRSEVIWIKRGGERPDLVKNRPVKDYERRF